MKFHIPYTYNTSQLESSSLLSVNYTMAVSTSTIFSGLVEGLYLSVSLRCIESYNTTTFNLEANSSTILFDFNQTSLSCGGIVLIQLANLKYTQNSTSTSQRLLDLPSATPALGSTQNGSLTGSVTSISLSSSRGAVPTRQESVSTLSWSHPFFNGSQYTAISAQQIGPTGGSMHGTGDFTTPTVTSAIQSSTSEWPRPLFNSTEATAGAYQITTTGFAMHGTGVSTSVPLMTALCTTTNSTTSTALFRSSPNSMTWSFPFLNNSGSVTSNTALVASTGFSVPGSGSMVIAPNHTLAFSTLTSRALRTIDSAIKHQTLFLLVFVASLMQYL
jgi:hypothetical protein